MCALCRLTVRVQQLNMETNQIQRITRGLHLTNKTEFDSQ